MNDNGNGKDNQENNEGPAGTFVQTPHGIYPAEIQDVIEQWHKTYVGVQILHFQIEGRIAIAMASSDAPSLMRYSYIHGILDAYLNHSKSFMLKLAEENGFEIVKEES